MVRTVYADAAGDLWVGTPGGLNRFRDGRFTAYTTRDGLSSNSIIVIYENRVLWVGTEDGIPAQNTETIAGQLETGKTTSFIVYVGMESGDYAAYCFANKSGVGRAILAKCRNGDRCEFVGEIADDDECTAPKLEATVSRSGNITKVTRVRRLKHSTR